MKRVIDGVMATLGTLLVHAPLFALLLGVGVGAAPPPASDLEVYDVDLLEEPPPLEAPEPPPPEPEPEPEPPAPESPEPEPAPEPAAPTAKPVPATPAPAKAPREAAQAGQALTAEGDDDIYDFTIVQGDGDSYVGGHTRADGTAREPVRIAPTRRPARPPPPRPPPPPPPPPPRPVRPARPGNASWSCPFPAPADLQQVDHARVGLRVFVDAAGVPRRVVVTSDPGYGFGAAAQQCALRERYRHAEDGRGRAVAGWTPTFIVTFRR